ncbi:MAG: SIS domain-containing protein, partial [Pseudomonadota bacterium]
CGRARHSVTAQTLERTSVTSHASQLDWAGASRLIIVACGTAAFAGMIAKYWFEQIAQLPVEVDIASEFRYRAPPIDGREIAIFISQSGETADTLAALRHVSGRVAATAAVVNVEESSIAREVDLILPILAGREIGVASTKAFTCQLTVLACTALLAARERGHLSAERETEL